MTERLGSPGQPVTLTAEQRGGAWPHTALVAAGRPLAFVTATAAPTIRGTMTAPEYAAYSGGAQIARTDSAAAAVAAAVEHLIRCGYWVTAPAGAVTVPIRNRATLGTARHD